MTDQPENADKTIIGRSSAPSLAYLFWSSGIGRGSYAKLEADGTTVGTAAAADVRIEDGLASAEQSRLRREGAEWFLYDLAAANTTLVHGKPVYRQQLQDKDVVTFGRSEAVFRTLG